MGAPYVHITREEDGKVRRDDNTSKQNVDPYFRDLACEVLDPLSKDFLERSGIARGMNVLDFGCGSGAMTGWLARTVAPEGRVVALDNSAFALESARRRTRSEGLTNVDFVLKPAHDVVSLGCRFDLIYGRFILMQLSNPFEALESLVSCLRPRGILAMDEPNQEADFALPPCPPCALANRTFMEFADSVGMSFRVGDSLFPMFRQLGCDILVSRALQPIVPIHLALQMFKHGLLDSMTPLIDSGVVDESGLDQLIAGLDSWVPNPGGYYAFSRQFQVSGRFP